MERIEAVVPQLSFDDIVAFRLRLSGLLDTLENPLRVAAAKGMLTLLHSVLPAPSYQIVEHIPICWEPSNTNDGDHTPTSGMLYAYIVF